MTFDVQGALFPNLLTMLAQLCATLVLFLLCKKLLWKPARKILDERRTSMNKSLTDAKKYKEEANEELNKAKSELELAKKESVDIISNARNEAENLKKDILDDANKAASLKIEDAEKRIEQKHEELKDEIKEEIVDVAMSAVKKLLNEKMTDEDDKKCMMQNKMVLLKKN